jgi:hypothetical protein
MRPGFAPAPVCRVGVAWLFLAAAWGLALVGRAEEPAQPLHLTAEQQKQLRQARAHAEQFKALWKQGKRAEAITAWQDKLALERRVWGQGRTNLISSLNYLALLRESESPALTRPCSAAKGATLLFSLKTGKVT